MQKYLYIIIIFFSLVSCYTYQVKKPAPVDPTANNKPVPVKTITVVDNDPIQMKRATELKKAAESQNPDSQQMPASINVQEKLTPNKNVKIDVDGKSYKVIVDRWESDSLVVHPVHNPKKVLKFHKNQINAEKIAEKRFSQPIADIITVVAYAGIGVAVWLLLR
ncbi:hypothetical protein SAMN05880574_11612 [Chryseobacterium sp. RU37D]|uniref:hypothetical protein n=1 Tax=Chryseobacterium sp. RU37D TaxID=1907397 RepID=UPI00095457D8|nr:hypothetical protein [Chryseobacterium sp. RU37D]SIQ54782.1 hypothetical protein SAMN05880574_11612 [Chryseobacterium sp. RU37D]